ncbi:MAG: phosphatidate cytidylyltransferase [Actinomycetes bacterium]
MATGIGLLLGALVLASLYVRKVAFVVLAVGALCLVVGELVYALRRSGRSVPLVPLLVGTAGMLVGAYVQGARGLVVVFVLTVLAVITWRLAEGPERLLVDLGLGVFIAAYAPLLAGFALLLLRAPDGADRVVVCILLVVASDVGGYAAGVLFGRHPLAASVSPKKSWEGLGGSLVATALAGALALSLLLHALWWHGVVLGLAVALSATFGDLVESLLKRDVGVKDMGALLPGHGGMSDRLDSLLMSAPLVYVLLGALAGTR